MKPMLPITLAALFLSSHCDARLAGRALQSICDDDSMQCPDGSFVSRDSTRNCEFKTCPEFKCCAWVLEPGKYANDKCESGSHVCCRNGEWGCAIPGLESSFMCNGAPTVGPFPDACPCCEPEIMPVCQVGEPQCCGHNGRWACPINIEGTEYNCGGDVLSRLDGPLCILKARDLADVNVAPGYEGGTNMPSASPNDGDAPSKAEVLQAGNEPEIFQAVEGPKAILQAKAVPVPSQTPPSMPTKSAEAETTELLGPPLRACKGPEIMCWDGSWVKPDPEKDCYTPPCPPKPCCDPTVPPRIRCGYGGPYCCEDGSWTCQSEQGTYTCGDSELNEPPDGDVCENTVEPTIGSTTEVKCCDPNLEPGQNGNPLCDEGHQCCPDGEWSCSIGDGETFPCGGELITEGFGKKCPCCDPTLPPRIRCGYGGPYCCEDGSWTCQSEEGTYTCGDSALNKPPDGDVCQTTVEPTVGFATEVQCCDPTLEPGQNGNPLCFEGHQCCPDGEWSCSIGDATTFPCGGKLITEGFGKKCSCCDPATPLTMKCGFGGPYCCEDGSWTCQTEQGTYTCGDSERVEPPDGDVCQTTVEPTVGLVTEVQCCNPTLEPGQNGNPLCFEGHQCCPDGKWSCSIGDAKTFPCGGKLITEGFGKKCPCCDPATPLTMKCAFGGPYCCEDGSWTCQTEQGTFTCGDLESLEPPDGDMCEATVEPTVGLTAEVKCCDPNLEPGQNGNPFCSEGHQCCPDGEWSCSIGDGETFPCGGELITEGFGKKCPCCDRESEPKCETGPAVCCDDGGWTCPIDEGGTIYDCGAGKESNPSGIICETGVISEKHCCDRSDILYCLIGSAGCCEDGSWSCPSNNIYSCGGYETKEPSGTICEEPGVVLPQACTKEAFICPDGSAVGRDPNNNCEFPPCPDVKTPDARPTGSSNEREKRKEEKRAERLKRKEERKKARRQKKREVARDKKEAERLKRQEEKAARQKERDEAKAQKEKERAERQKEAAKNRAEAKAARDSRHSTRQETKAAEEQELAKKRNGPRNGRGYDSEHESKSHSK